jgi:threonine aldolase
MKLKLGVEMPLSCSRTFASDNWSGVQPDIFSALAEANTLHAPAYGNDSYTENAKKLMEQEFGADISALFVLTGTAANVIAVATLLQPGEDALCAETAHVHAHEHGVHEKFSGTRFFLMPTKDGKITPDELERRLQKDDAKWGNPRLLVITNATEYGTVYTPQETQELVTCAHRNKLIVYLDGARLANSAAALNLSLADITVNVGVDAFSLGGTKNGFLFGDAIVFKNGKEYGKRAEVFYKFGLQNTSKLRFVTAQFHAYLQNSLWRKIALQANKATVLLADELKKRNVKIIQKPEANHVWASFPPAIALAIAEKHYGHIDGNGHNRFVTSWDTEAKDIQDFMAWLDKQRFDAN